MCTSGNYRLVGLSLAVSLFAGSASAQSQPLKTAKGTIVTTNKFAPNGAVNKAALEYQEFLLDSNSKLLTQVANKKREVQKLTSELAKAKGKIQSLESSFSELAVQNEQLKSECERAKLANSQRGQEALVPPVDEPMRVVVKKPVPGTAPDTVGFANGNLQELPKHISYGPPPVKLSARTLSNSAAFYLARIQQQISTSLSDPPYGGYGGMVGAYSFEIAADGCPQFVDDGAGSLDREFVRKIKYVIAKAGPFRRFCEPNTSNRLQVELEAQAGDNGAPRVKLSMI